MDKKKVAVILFIVAIVLLIASVLVSLNLKEGNESNIQTASPSSNAANVQLIVEEGTGETNAER